MLVEQHSWHLVVKKGLLVMVIGSLLVVLICHNIRAKVSVLHYIQHLLVHISFQHPKSQGAKCRGTHAICYNAFIDLEYISGYFELHRQQAQEKVS